MNFGEKYHRDKVPVLAYQGYILSTRLITVDVDLHHLDVVVFVRILYCKLFSPPFHTVLFRKKSVCTVHLRSGELSSTVWGCDIYIKLFGILLHGSFFSSPQFINVFSHFVISVWSHESYTLGYKPILLNFITQIVPALATVSSFRWLLCSFDML